MKPQFNRNQIFAFHIGKGGQFNKPGFLTFLGDQKISDFTQNLYLQHKNIESFLKRYGYQRIKELANGGDYFMLEEEFGITEDMLGELIYIDNSGRKVGLSLAESKIGVGGINMDHCNETTYTRFLCDCNKQEKMLIAEHYNLDQQETANLLLID